MAKRHTKSVSVSGDDYERWQEIAIARGISMTQLVDTACENLPTDPAEVAALSDRVWANMPANSRTARGG